MSLQWAIQVFCAHRLQATAMEHRPGCGYRWWLTGSSQAQVLPWFQKLKLTAVVTYDLQTSCRTRVVYVYICLSLMYIYIYEIFVIHIHVCVFTNLYHHDIITSLVFLPHLIQVDRESANIGWIGVTGASKKSQAADQNPVRSRNPWNLNTGIWNNIRFFEKTGEKGELN